MSAPTGVLLMAYGTPDTLDNVEPYYTHIRRGRPPSPELLQELRDRYTLVGGTTPLLQITEATRHALEEQLNARGSEYRVFLGMKHWHPYIEQGVREMARAGIRRAVGLVLAPHYSRGSIAEYYAYVSRAQEGIGSAIEILPINSWHLHSPYLAALANRIQAGLAAFPSGEEVTVVFTAHSLPQRIVAEGDPYAEQLMETSRTLAERLDLPRWTFSFQSAGRTPEPWLGPDLVETVNRLADEGVRNILVASVGFVSDHLEILYDIDYEARTAALARGVTLKRTEMFNASPDFVEGLADLVQARVTGAPPA